MSDLQDCVVSNDAKATLPLHRHDDARLIVVLDGEVRETDLGGQHRYVKGDLLFRPPFCAHANSASGAPSSFMRLQVSKDAWRQMIHRNGWRPLRGRIDLESRLHRSMLHASNCSNDIAALLSHPNNRDETVDPTDGDDLEAGRTDGGQLRPYEITRRFVRRFGLTPTAYRREARLQRAYSMLLLSDYPLARIAAECSYADQSHFSRELKSATGWSPRAFRRAFAP